MAQSVSETVIAHKMLSHWNCLLHFGICSIFLKKATEVNATKFVVMKRTKVNQENMEKQKTQRTENGGKGWEDRGKGRTLKMEVLPETCPKGFYHGF